MRQFNMVLEVPDDYNYADEILYMMACEFGAQAGIKVKIARDEPRAAFAVREGETRLVGGREVEEDSRAVVASSIARADAAGLVEKYDGLRRFGIVADAEDRAFNELYDAYALLSASYDEMLAERESQWTKTSVGAVSK